MSRYRRAKIEGGVFFFTVTLADRSSDLLVRHIDRLRCVYSSVQKRYPFETIRAFTPVFAGYARRAHASADNASQAGTRGHGATDDRLCGWHCTLRLCPPYRLCDARLPHATTADNTTCEIFNPALSSACASR